MITQAIARLLTKKCPQGCKYEQERTISLGDQENGDPDQGDPRVAKRFWRSQSDLWGLVGEAQCSHGRDRTHFIPTKKKPARVKAQLVCPPFCLRKLEGNDFLPERVAS